MLKIIKHVFESRTVLCFLEQSSNRLLDCYVYLEYVVFSSFQTLLINFLMFILLKYCLLQSSSCTWFHITPNAFFVHKEHDNRNGTILKRLDMPLDPLCVVSPSCLSWHWTVGLFCMKTYQLIEPVQYMLSTIT